MKDIPLVTEEERREALALAEVVRMRERLKDVPASTSRLIKKHGWELEVTYAGESRLVRSEDELCEWLSKFGRFC